MIVKRVVVFFFFCNTRGEWRIIKRTISFNFFSFSLSYKHCEFRKFYTITLSIIFCFSFLKC